MAASVLPRTALVALVALTAACGSKSGNTGPSPSQTETRTVTQYFAAIAAVGDAPGTATTLTGTAPAPAGGPTATATSIPQTADAGLGVIALQGSSPFQTVYISIGAAQSSRVRASGAAPLWARLRALVEAPVGAAAIQTTGYMQITLPSAVTSTSLVINFASSLPTTFEIRIQIAASPGGAAGPVATVQKTLQTGGGLIEIVGVVYGHFGPDPNNPLGPGLYSPLLAGAVVSTSLDGRTTTTNANGVFDLLTDTANAPNRCFRVNITAAGYPAYSSQGWVGSNKESGGVRFTLDPPQPPDLKSCN